MTRLALVALFSWLPLTLVAAEAPKEKAPAKAEAPKAEAPKGEAPKEAKLDPGTYAHLKTAKGEIVFRLLEDKAPKTAANFVELAKGERPWKTPDGRWVAKPFYNGLAFFRIENDALKLIQAGSPTGDESGGPGYTLGDEVDKELKFDKPGVVAMWSSGSTTSGSQFFITVAPAPSLDGRHTIFGQVVRGFDAAEAISTMPTSPKGAGDAAIHVAKEPVAIQSVTFETIKEEAKPAPK